MNYIFLCIAFITFFGCNNIDRKKEDPNKTANNCLWLTQNKKPIEELLENKYAKSVSDSFKNFLYISNFETKLKREFGNDSISVLCLKAEPYILATPRGDSVTFGLIYAFTDLNCTRYYDSILKNKSPIIHGIRFSILEKKIICYITSDGKLLQNSNYMNLEKITIKRELAEEIKKNKDSINEDLINFLSKNAEKKDTAD